MTKTKKGMGKLSRSVLDDDEMAALELKAREAYARVAESLRNLCEADKQTLVTACGISSYKPGDDIVHLLETNDIPEPT